MKRKKHQYIVIDGQDLVGMVGRFDLNFCKVYYDGKTLHVMDWDSIMTSTTKINWEFDHRSTRAEKYRQRGFTIIDDNDNNDNNE